MPVAAAPSAVWKGSDVALRALQLAIMRNCACSGGPAGFMMCTSHQMLLDQRTLDHLNFVRERIGDYQLMEFDPFAHWR